MLGEFERQQLGHTTPGIPVLLWGSTHDDVIPIQQVRDVRDRWADLGADVTWHESGLPRAPGRTGMNHFGPYFRHLTDHSGWLLDRLHGA